MIEVYGDHSTAKSGLGYAAIAAFQRAGGITVLIDSEAKADKTFVEQLGVDWSKMTYIKGEHIKECVQLLGRVAQLADPETPTLIVWDSIAATPGSEELELHTSDKEYTGEKAMRARYLSAAFRATMGDLSRKGVTMLAINQVRTNFNFMGSTFLETPGGKAPKFHSAVRLKMKTRGRIKHKAADVVVGIMVEVEATKNQCSPPFRKTEVRFNFDSGFAPYSGLDSLLLRHGRLNQKGGWLTYEDKSFHAGDIERIISEMPGLIEPLRGTLDQPVDPVDLGSGTAPISESETSVVGRTKDGDE